MYVFICFYSLVFIYVLLILYVFIHLFKSNLFMRVCVYV